MRGKRGGEVVGRWWGGGGEVVERWWRGGERRWGGVARWWRGRGFEIGFSGPTATRSAGEYGGFRIAASSNLTAPMARGGSGVVAMGEEASE